MAANLTQTQQICRIVVTTVQTLNMVNGCLYNL